MDSQNSPKALVLTLIVIAVGVLGRAGPSSAFTPIPSPLNVPAHCLPNGSAIRFADVTGDGGADAIAVNLGALTVRRSHDLPLPNVGPWFLPNEPGTANPVLGTRGTYFADVTGPDADGRRRADAIAVNDTGITVRRSSGGAGGGVFPFIEAFTSNPYFGERGTFFADVTGDGKADAIVVNLDGVTVRRSDGTQFLPNQSGTTEPFFGTRGTYFADVTGDGRADAIAVDDTGLTVLPARDLTSPTLFSSDQAIGATGSFVGTRGTFFADVTGPDADGRRRADAIAVNETGITVRRGQLSPPGGELFSFEEQWTSNNPYFGAVGTYFADVDADGMADAIVVNLDSVTIRRSDGFGFLPNQVGTSNPYYGEFAPVCLE